MNINRLIDAVEICPKSLRRLDKFYNTYKFDDISSLLNHFFSYRRHTLFWYVDDSIPAKEVWEKVPFKKRESPSDKSLAEIGGKLDDEGFFVICLTHHLYSLIRFFSKDRSIINDKDTFENIKDDIYTLTKSDPNKKTDIYTLIQYYNKLVMSLNHYPEEVENNDWFIHRKSLDILTDTKIINLKKAKLHAKLSKEFDAQEDKNKNSTI